MAKRLYVGNLSFKMTNSDLETLFAPFGSVRNRRWSWSRVATAAAVLGSWKWSVIVRQARRSLA